MLSIANSGGDFETLLTLSEIFHFCGSCVVRVELSGTLGACTVLGRCYFSPEAGVTLFIDIVIGAPSSLIMTVCGCTLMNRRVQHFAALTFNN